MAASWSGAFTVPAQERQPPRIIMQAVEQVVVWCGRDAASR
jgi:hypothetical protein